MKGKNEAVRFSSEDRSKLFVELIHEKKGKDVVLLDLRNIPEAVSDFFLICHGDSTTQVKAIADFLVQETKKRNVDQVNSTEGTSNAEWALIDFGDIVVHVFLRDVRQIYQLEELWSDAQVIEYKNVV